MWANLRSLVVAGGVLAGLWAGEPAFAQKSGGVLRIPMGTSPASMSIHEESTIAALGPMMGVFNNLVMFDQHVPQNNLESIVPDLAASWSSSEDGKELIFKLRSGVKWHDGKPFTSADVKCTWDLITGKSGEKLRVNPRKSWYRNLEEVTTNGDLGVSFRLKRPQASFLALLASGWSPVYPCHVSPRDMRSHPIGTGPFKFVEFKPNESIKVVRNPDYWKPGRPYLDAIEYRLMPNPATTILAFAAGKFDRTVGIAIGIAAVGAGTIIGALVAVTCSPRHFAMPSLMADLGAIEPSFDLPVAAVVTGIALVAVALGMAPTVWWLHKRSVASALSEQGR